MEIQQLKYFVEICHTRNFARAAENCFVSPQGIGMAIQRLEAELQCQLFIRQRTALRLTNHAKFLLPLAEKITDNMNACEKYFSIGKNYEQRVPLVLARGAFVEFAGAPIQEFKDKYPHIYLDLRNGNDIEAETAVLCKETEIALCSGPINNNKLDARYICSSRFAAFVNKTHPLAERMAISVSDLTEYPLTIMQEHTKTYPLLVAAAREACVELWIHSRVDNMLLVFETSENDGQVGVATMALAPLVAGPNSGLVAIPFVEQELKWSLHIIKRKDEPLTPNAVLLYEMLLAHRDRLTRDN